LTQYCMLKLVDDKIEVAISIPVTKWEPQKGFFSLEIPVSHRYRPKRHKKKPKIIPKWQEQMYQIFACYDSHEELYKYEIMWVASMNYNLSFWCIYTILRR
jgi:hypothetical protein